jgi:hypothetical protein
MKHIRLFEDYSDEELRALQDDLHGIGHKTKFVRGEDFGFNPDFKGENKGGIPLRFSKEMFDDLQKMGELKITYEDLNKNDIRARFTNPEKFGVPPAENWVYSAAKSGQFFIDTYGKVVTEEIAKKFSEIRR